jgi:hypothetical protein
VPALSIIVSPHFSFCCFTLCLLILFAQSLHSVVVLSCLIVRLLCMYHRFAPCFVLAVVPVSFVQWSSCHYPSLSSMTMLFFVVVVPLLSRPMLCAIACIASYLFTHRKYIHSITSISPILLFLCFPGLSRSPTWGSPVLKNKWQAAGARVCVHVRHCICCFLSWNCTLSSNQLPSLTLSLSPSPFINHGFRGEWVTYAKTKEKLTERRSIPAASSLGTRFSRGIGL